MGSWEVHSVVGLVSAGEDTLWGVLSLAGGMGRCAVSGCFGYEWADGGWVSSIFRPVTPTGSGFGWGYTGARGGRYLCVVAVLRLFRYWIGHEHILLGSTLTPGGSLSARCNL